MLFLSLRSIVSDRIGFSVIPFRNLMTN
jgi:hypothetical protein